MTYKFKGYHGTSLEAANNIIATQYNISIGYKEWLGDGVYFFVNGLSSTPQEQAKEWAIATSWNNENKNHDYTKYGVLETSIVVDNLLDLTVEEGVNVLTFLCDELDAKIHKHQSSQGKYKAPLEGFLINLAREEGIIPIDVVKGNFYIKFTKQRLRNLNFKVANCTICSVYNKKQNLLNNRIVEQGEVLNKIRINY